jgi:hypothetical protein
VLGTALVPPNNQGHATPFYNDGDNGEKMARKGVATNAELDRYTRQAITNLNGGYVSFAGQRDDGFYADVQSLFDLLKLRKPSKDAQGGFNLHLMELAIPISELGGDQQTAGVYATTSRLAQPVIRQTGSGLLDLLRRPQYVQVARRATRFSARAWSRWKTRTATAAPAQPATANSSANTPRTPNWQR